MKIREIHLQDFKKHEDLHIKTPGGENIFLIGDNDTGKTSVIQAIFGALKAVALPKSVIRDGADESKVFLVIGDEEREYRVTLKITDDHEQLVIKDKNDNTVSKPVNSIKELVGGLIYDVFELSEMNPKDQIAWIKEKFNIDVTQHENNIALHYDNRRQVNRDLKKLKGEIANSGITTAAIKASKEIDIKELNAQLQDANNINNAINMLKQQNENKEREVKNHIEEVDKMKAQIKQLQQAILVRGDKIQSLVNEIKENEDVLATKEYVNISDMQAQLNEAVEHNRKHARIIDIKNKMDAADELESESNGLTQAIQAERKQIQLKVADSKLPQGFALYIPDQEETREGLYLNDKPFSPMIQSTSDIMKSTLSLQDAINPNGLKIACIHRFESMGMKKRIEVGKFIVQHDLQAIIELMQPGGNTLVIKEKI